MISEDLITFSDWFKDNLLVLNADKTKMLLYNSNRKEFSSLPDIFLNNVKISEVDEVKYLIHI